MKIIAHRGLHHTRREANTAAALTRALSAGFGVEADIRDRAGKLVIAHDPPKDSAPPLAALLAGRHDAGSREPLALNIKADGLAPLLMPLLKRYRIRQYFLFDMSGPEMVRYLAAGARVFTRQSEYEPHPACYARAHGVWLDEFTNDWIKETVVRGHVRAGKQLCFVSPELHGRDPLKRWKFYRRMEQAFPNATFMLCTDYPEKAATFFHD